MSIRERKRINNFVSKLFTSYIATRKDFFKFWLCMYILEPKSLQFKTDEGCCHVDCVMPSFIFAFRKSRANVIVVNEERKCRSDLVQIRPGCG